MPRNSAIDALRFICAFVVVMHHAYIPAFMQPYHAFYSAFWFGPSAVVVFFVISGLCIHGPYVTADKIDWRAYFTRRYVRIVLPLACIVPIGALVNVSYHPYGGWITWSLICEMIYYAIYPLVRIAARRLGWIGLVGAAYVAGYSTLIMTDPASDNLFVLIARDAISYFPAWLLGCLIAELLARKTPHVAETLGLWPTRIVVFVASFAAGLLQGTGTIGLHWTLPAFALLAAAWVLIETRSNRLPERLGALGAWSYSLYLVHPAAFGAFFALSAFLPVGSRWPLGVAFVLLASYAFFLAVELPSHLFARRLSVAVASVRAPID